MHQNAHDIAAFFVQVGGAISAHWLGAAVVLLAVLPSIVTALTDYPRAQAVAKFALAILNALDRASVLAHRDSPGTLKPPLVKSTAPAPRTLQTSVMSASGVPLVTRPADDDVTPTARPGTALKVIAFGLFALSAHTAQAQVLSMGPSLPLLEVRLADPATNKPTSGVLAQGAGYQLGLGFFQRAIMGKEFDLLDLDFLAFGTIAQEGGQALDRASIAGAVCTLNSLVCMGFGVDLIQYYGGNGGQISGILGGSVGRQNLFPLLSLGFDFELGPTSPPTGVADGAAGLPRGNTINFGSM